MDAIPVKNLLPLSMILLAIFLANATAKMAVIKTVAARIWVSRVP